MLLAKKSTGFYPDVTLLGHTMDVEEARKLLFGDGNRLTRLGECWLRFFRLDPIHHTALFTSHLQAAVLFHDLGKANHDMQEIFAGSGQSQKYRHEHLSTLLLATAGFDRWVRQRSDIDWDFVLAAVGSHHLKFSDQDFAPYCDAVQVYFADREFQDELLPFVGKELGLKELPETPPQKHWGEKESASTLDMASLRDALKNGRLRAIKVKCRDMTSSTTRMLHAVRSGLMIADAVGSALRRTGSPIASWIAERFDNLKPLPSEFINQLIDHRVSDLRSRNQWRNWNEFQLACDTLPSRSLLLAPCGSGKTLAAWRWISAQAKARPVNRVLFLYPTRATATEGFKDYVSWAPEADGNSLASLMHGTADYDLDEMFPAEDPRSSRMFGAGDPRLFALQHWSKRVFSATIDQFFAFLSYSYGPICLLPMLADSIIVIDEIHSFDRAMFSGLERFLEAFDVPVLCMTATLQAARKQKLRQLLQTYEDKPGELQTIADAPRYKVARIQASEAADKARAALSEGKRVLWVVNQVNRAQAIALDLADVKAPLVCYHSRFKLDDRIDRHRETLDRIQAGKPAALAVSTQVCEMSLDIDADVLITEECPIPSLIQRMGRCRRGRNELSVKGPGEVFVYQPADKERVYSSDDLTGLQAFVDFLQALPAASQAHLEAGMEKHGSKVADAEKLIPFLVSGPYAMGREDSFRDIEEHNRQAVLDCDLDAYLSASKQAQPGYVLPVPKKCKPVADARLPRHLSVADGRHYDPKLGFCDEAIR